MHVENSQMSPARKDPRAFVMTMSLIIVALTMVAVITTQVGVPLF